MIRKKPHNHHPKPKTKKTPPTPPPKPNTQNQQRTKLNQAAELESRLSSLTLTKSSEAKASHLRIQLCELFSDVLLTDANLSSRKDVSGRMWRSCFYGRIAELRSCTAKEKARWQKMRKLASAKENWDVVSKEEAMEKQKRSVAELEASLDTFLKEAVVLYDYLVDKYQGMLCAHSLNSLSQTQSPPSSEDDVSEHCDVEERKMEGVVPTLFRLYIHLGDLFRYSSNFSAAESAYLKAACLAPGKGNPYNQLAVVAQLKDSTGAHPLPAVALYWYCRSLLSVHDSFETSRANLERLFVANQNWIRVHIENGGGEEETGICTVGMNREKARAIKSLASRKFLSLFVDFHGDLFGVMSRGPDGNTSGGVLDHAEMKMEKLMKRLNSLLTESAFSDALLIKMVSINAFSIWNCLSFVSDSSSSFRGATTISLAFLYAYGVQLAVHVDGSLGKLATKQQVGGSQKKGTVIRLLTPLLLLCEFISYLWKDDEKMKIFLSRPPHVDDSPFHSPYIKNQKEFWSRMTLLANNLLKSSVVMSMIEDNAQESVTGGPVTKTELFDYKVLRGYAPFASFVRNDSEKVANSNADDKDSNVYLTPQEALNVLELSSPLTQSQSLSHSQSSKKSNGSSKSADKSNNRPHEAETREKLTRFFNFLNRHVTCGIGKGSTDMDEAHFLTRSDDGQFSCVIDQEAGKAIITNEKSSDSSMSTDEEEDTEKAMNENSSKDNIIELLHESEDENVDEEEDIIVYKPSDTGTALLVPGALLLANNGSKEKSDVLSTANDTNVGAISHGDPNSTKERDILLNPSSLLLDSSSKNNSPTSNGPKTNVTLRSNQENVFLHQGQVDLNGFSELQDQDIPALPQSSSPKVSGGNKISSAIKPPPGFLPSTSPTNDFNSQSAQSDGMLSHYPAMASNDKTKTRIDAVFVSGLNGFDEKNNQDSLPVVNPNGVGCTNVNVTASQVLLPPPPGFQAEVGQSKNVGQSGCYNAPSFVAPTLSGNAGIAQQDHPTSVTLNPFTSPMPSLGYGNQLRVGNIAQVDAPVGNFSRFAFGRTSNDSFSLVSPPPHHHTNPNSSVLSSPRNGVDITSGSMDEDNYFDAARSDLFGLRSLGIFSSRDEFDYTDDMTHSNNRMNVNNHTDKENGAKRYVNGIPEEDLHAETMMRNITSTRNPFVEP